MQSAISEVVETGREVLGRHRQAGPEAAERADQWQLGERLDAEKVALIDLFDAAREIIEAADKVRGLLRQRTTPAAELHAAMEGCSSAVETGLPRIEQAFLTARHSALDLLQWTSRAGRIEGSELPGKYRASYAKLTSYTPLFRPRLEAIQQALLERSRESGAAPELKQTLSALSRFNAVADSARAFVKSIVEPPLELVFHDTDLFHQDWDPVDPDQKQHLATEFNDCCQLLLYDREGFSQRVEHRQPVVSEDVEGSLFVFSESGKRVIFTVDEDPVFGELVVTLLRVVDESNLEAAYRGVVELLYHDLADDPSDD